MTLKFWRAAAGLLMAGLLAGSCASGPDPTSLPSYHSEFDSTDRGLTSRYFKPKGTGKTYAYGNFCGPGVPLAEGDPSNLQKAAAIKPVDTIDRACKLHDMCYMKFGRDNPECDLLTYSGGLAQSYPNLGSPLKEQCSRLIGEVGQGIGIKLTGGISLATDAMIGATVMPLSAATDAVLGVLGVFSGIDNLGGEPPPKNMGFPAKPGHCNADYGAAETYVGFAAFPFGLAGIDHDKTELAEVLALESLHAEMTCLAELASGKAKPDCHRISNIAFRDGREAYYSFPAADVQYFLDTGQIRAMPNDQIRKLRQPHPLMAGGVYVKR